MMIPMALAHPSRAWSYAWLNTWTSVAGGILGYSIGAYLYDTIGHWVIELYGYGDKVEAFRQLYAQYGMWIIVLKGMTPIPYKLVTITSGFAGYNIWLFIIFSFVARGMRFFIGAFLIWKYGERARSLIEERLGLFFTIAVLVIVVGVVAAFYLF